MNQNGYKQLKSNLVVLKLCIMSLSRFIYLVKEREVRLSEKKMASGLVMYLVSLSGNIPRVSPVTFQKGHVSFSRCTTHQMESRRPTKHESELSTQMHLRSTKCVSKASQIITYVSHLTRSTTEKRHHSSFPSMLQCSDFFRICIYAEALVAMR